MSHLIEIYNDNGELYDLSNRYEVAQNIADTLWIQLAEIVKDIMENGDLNDLKELHEIVPRGMFKYRIAERIEYLSSKEE